MWDGQGKIKIYYGMSKVRKQLSGKRSIYGTIKAAGNFNVARVPIRDCITGKF